MPSVGDWLTIESAGNRMRAIAFDFQKGRGGTVNTGYGRYSRVSVSEQLIFTVTVEELDRILNASPLEMKIKEELFTFDVNTLRALRELSDYAKRQP